MRKTRTPLLTTLLMFILCTTILVGATTAYFTETVQVSGNVVQSGNLKAEMYWTDSLVPGENNEIQWIDASKETADDTAIFSYEQWEPGFTAVRFLQIRNAGRLAFQYQLNVLPQGALIGKANLMDAIDVYYGAVPQLDATAQPSLNVKDYATFKEFTDTLGLERMGTLSQLNASTREHTWGVMLPSVATPNAELPAGVTASTGAEEFCIVLHMQEDAGNEYQQCGIEKGFVLQLTATQYTYEKDSFGHDYDTEAVSMLPVYTSPVTVTADITGKVSTEGTLTEAVTLSSGDVSATVPAGAQIAPGATSLTLRISPMALSGANLTLGQTEETASYDVHVEGIAPANTLPVTITMGEVLPTGLNMGNYSLHHVENGATFQMNYVASGELEKHNDFKYDPATGFVTVAMAKFSEVALVAEPSKWEGEFDYSWYDASKSELTIANADQLAGFGAIVGGMAKDENGNALDRDSFSGKTVKLIADIDLGDKNNANDSLIFHPIGYYYTDDKNADGTTGDYYSTVNSFQGTFDGNGHTIANFYHNTWEIKGDYDGNYYKDGMGLFGYVVNGKVCNLTVDNFSSDGEFTPTGVIAAYAVNSTFENIAITNCNPRVYNTGNGGIIGVAGNSNDQGTQITLKNITVDNSNKISALWGSWDVACGGLVGMFRGNADGGTGKIHFENCHVSAQIDVYNDVCANYQYYAYRYAGMMIGSIRHNTTNADGKTIPNMAGVSASGCTVNYGDWNDYYYCEFEKNSIASYSEDYQFSRVPHSELNFTDSNGNGVVDANERASVTGCKHTHTAEEDKQAVYLPFHQLFTGYSWGVSSVGLEKYSGIVTDLDITEGDQQESLEKFASKVSELANNTAIKLGDIFNFVDNGVELKPAALTVTVTNLDENNPVSSKFARDDTNWENGTLTLTGTGNVEITIQDYYFCKPTTITVEVTARQDTEKFETKFTGDFLYRVGNQNAVSIGSLFKEKGGTEIGTVSVNIENVAGNASGSYNANSTWTNGTIQFSGTGVVKITITDNDYCIPTELILEVVEAKNITSATSATDNNVVLLNNTSGSFTVSNGYTFYGNGFKVTLPTTVQSKYSAGYVGYVTLTGGNLDNVQIEGPVYPEMYIYRDQAKDSSDDTKANYFYNSVLINGGNCTISNSYISGSRTALCVRGGNNVVLKNSTLFGGAYANMEIAGASSVTLRDLTTVQVDVDDSYSKNKTAHGLGIAVSSSVVNINIEGKINQYNWLCQTQWDRIVPSTYQNQFPKFFTDSTFSKYWHYLNGGTTPYVNMGFIFACNWDTSKIHDNRTTVDYGTCNATIANVAGGVYSKTNTVGGNTIANADLINPGYISPGFNPVTPVFNFDNTANNDADDEASTSDTYCVYEESSSTLKIGVTGKSKTLDLSGISITKAGSTLDYTSYLNGTKISGNTVTLNIANGTTQTLSFKATTNDAGYSKDGTPIEGTVEYNWAITVEVAVLAFPAPVWNMDGTYTFNTINCVYAYYSTSDGYAEAVPIYEGIKVTYYNKLGTLENLDFSGTTALPTGSNNSNSNAFTYTLPDGSTLTMKFSSGWKTGATTHQFTVYQSKVYIYPQSLDNNGYIRAKTTNQDFDVKITYNFTDPNGQSTGEQTMQWYNAKASNGSVPTVQWKTFDSTNGKEPSCLTPSTLITLADGSPKRVDSLTGNEQLLVWNLETGKLDAAPILFIDSEPEAEYQVVHLYFSDSTDVEVIFEHGFWDYDLNKYVYLDENAAQYIGHSFFKRSGDSGEKVTLTSVVIENQTTTAWSPVTAGHLCYFVNGMLSMPGGVGGLFNIFDVDPITMTYDTEAMARDIETYGLFTYEELAAHCPALTEKMFEAAGGAYLKVSIGKGNMTMDELIEMINRYAKFF